LPLNRYLVQVDIPDDVWTKRDMVDRAALVGWDAMPAGMVSLDFGDKWVSSGTSCLLEVPSAIVPEEANILINPAHPDAAKITAVKVRKWVYDARIKP